MLMLVKISEQWKSCIFSKTNCSLPNKIGKKKYRKNSTAFADTWVSLLFFRLILCCPFHFKFLGAWDFMNINVVFTFFNIINCICRNVMPKLFARKRWAARSNQLSQLPLLAVKWTTRCYYSFGAVSCSQP